MQRLYYGTASRDIVILDVDTVQDTLGRTRLTHGLAGHIVYQLGTPLDEKIWRFTLLEPDWTAANSLMTILRSNSSVRVYDSNNSINLTVRPVGSISARAVKTGSGIARFEVQFEGLVG